MKKHAHLKTVERRATELLVGDIARAQKFYCELFGIRRNGDGALPVVLKQQSAEVSSRGASRHGTLTQFPVSVHLGIADSLERALTVAWECGGTVVESARRIRKGRWRAMIVDCEGNLIALHAVA